MHFSHKPPRARAIEPDWYKAMDRPLDQLRKICIHYSCPCICAGDVFDSPDAPPELINWLMKSLPPDFYAVPGQHDLKWHSYEDIKKTAYWTLVQSNTIYNIPPKGSIPVGNLYLHGFPWEHEVHHNPMEPHTLCLHLAVIHQYIWDRWHRYKDASRNEYYKKMWKNLKGYDFAMFGDNHKGFLHLGKKCHVLNCGAFMRRDIDQINYQPKVGLLHANGGITMYKLDCSKDKFIDPIAIKELESKELNLTEFMEDLLSLGAKAVDFKQAIKHWCRKHHVSKTTRNLILSSMEDKDAD